MGAYAPFGYKKDPADKNHLIADEETAPTIRYIFQLALEGYGNNKIGKILYEEKIPKPAYYNQEILDWHTKVKPCTSGYDNKFRGILKCADCGNNLTIHTDGRNPDRPLLEKTIH